LASNEEFLRKKANGCKTLKLAL